MLHASVKMTIKYCACTPLVNTLFLMQFMPNGSKTPNAAVHFGMLDFLHVFKMEAQVSNHSFTDAINLLMEKKGVELQKTVLNNVYFQYRHIVNHSTGLIMEKNHIQQSNCYTCDNAEGKTVTLDGNFQLKRLNSQAATEVNTGIFSPSSAEKRLWGDEQEVQKFDREAEVNKDEDRLVQNIMDNNFKATSNNNYQLNKQ
ncbi:hypothetical protein BDF21DRAFT_417115 [Thamnidium elegans]|nr:hypothetical protein BDF21DRAFT_417115 [Thamnidium elegans]